MKTLIMFMLNETLPISLLLRYCIPFNRSSCQYSFLSFFTFFAKMPSETNPQRLLCMTVTSYICLQFKATIWTPHIIFLKLLFLKMVYLTSYLQLWAIIRFGRLLWILLLSDTKYAFHRPLAPYSEI